MQSSVLAVREEHVCGVVSIVFGFAFEVLSPLILWTEELNCPFVDLSVSSSNCTVGLHRAICAVITARVWPA